MMSIRAILLLFTSLTILVSSCKEKNRVEFYHFDKFEGLTKSEEHGYYTMSTDSTFEYYVNRKKDSLVLYKVVQWMKDTLIINRHVCNRLSDSLFLSINKKYNVSSFLLDIEGSADEEEYYFINDNREIVLTVAVNYPVSSHFVYKRDSSFIADALLRYLSENSYFWPGDPPYWERESANIEPD